MWTILLLLAVGCKKADSCRLGSYPFKQDFVVLLRQIGAQRRPPVRQTPPRRNSRICACARMHRHSASVRDAAARARAYCPSSVAGVRAVLLRRCRREIGKSGNRKKWAFHCRRRTKRRQLGTLFFRRRPHDNGTAFGTLQTAKTRCFPPSKHEKAVCFRTEIMNAFPSYWRTAFADSEPSQTVAFCPFTGEIAAGAKCRRFVFGKIYATVQASAQRFA